MKPKPILLFGFLLIIFSNIASSQELYTGVWRQSNSAHYLWVGVSWQDFNAKWNELAKINLRLINIKTYNTILGRRFSGVWIGGSDAYALTPAGLDWTAFSKFWSDNSKKGLRLINVETYTDNGKLYFLGVFRAGNDGYALTPLNLDWNEFNKFWSDNSKKGLRLINIESYMNGGKRGFLGVFRAGTDGYVLSPYGKDWNQFTDYWKTQSGSGLRLVDIEPVKEGNKMIYLGVWRAGSDNHYLWGGVDWENFSSKWAQNNAANLRLMDLESFETNCENKCLNEVLMPDDPSTTKRDSYNYGILAGKYHCEGLPGTCPTPGSGDKVWYRWPNLAVGSDIYARTSLLYDAKDQIFTLPFKAASSEMKHNAWLYSDGTWHYALDYSRTGTKTFEICAAAPGKVIYIGWDNWSGNTMIISHNAGGKTDVYRTIYMHLQNGPANDCEAAWTKTIADPDINNTNKNEYKSYLNKTGCPLDKTKRDPQSDFWGTDSKKIDMSLLNKNVSAGQVVAWAGSTGPGGCGCANGGSGKVNTHLHIFYAHKDPADNKWYFIDPYGIYSGPDCYPTPVDGAINTPCSRYPVTWKGGSPKYGQ